MKIVRILIIMLSLITFFKISQYIKNKKTFNYFLKKEVKKINYKPFTNLIINGKLIYEDEDFLEGEDKNDNQLIQARCNMYFDGILLKYLKKYPNNKIKATSFTHTPKPSMPWSLKGNEDYNHQIFYGSQKARIKDLLARSSYVKELVKYKNISFIINYFSEHITNKDVFEENIKNYKNIQEEKKEIDKASFFIGGTHWIIFEKDYVLLSYQLSGTQLPNWKTEKKNTPKGIFKKISKKEWGVHPIKIFLKNKID